MKKIFLSGLIGLSLIQTIEARGFQKNVSSSTLTSEQISSVMFMYEEEKVARDVYITLERIWQQRIFENIASSEQKHMNAVKNILTKNNVVVNTTDIGVFNNIELQNLYNELVEQGKTSLLNALLVGKTIEEKDIIDLKAQISIMPYQVSKVYNNLLNGSYNHLNAFTSTINRLP